ncbi:hypothetical protein [Paenibacillus humicola]|uniref:hypothetical protein n=1 Tax=Paenibacillus humicola TaxID=3110540 RepID=UPI00237B59ED|nr:hypothetical protein [Paenibacillus humicola]
MAKSNKQAGFRLPPAVLRRTAAYLVPFYRKIAADRTFACRWSAAVRGLDPDRMQRLLKSVVPRARLDGLSTNGIGYFIDFAFPAPVLQYSCGTSIPPGKARFAFPAPAHRKIAAAVLPFYRALSCSPGYAAAIAKSVREGRREALSRLVRLYVRSAALRSADVDAAGIRLVFRFTTGKYEYDHLLYRDIPD